MTMMRMTMMMIYVCRDINDGLKGPNVTSASSVNDMMT